MRTRTLRRLAFRLSNFFSKPVRRQPVRRQPDLAARRRFFNLHGESLEPRTLLAAVVGTDKDDYAPGETVQISASGFGGYQPVIFKVTRIEPPADGALPGDGPWVVVDNNAAFNADPDGDGNVNWT